MIIPDLNVLLYAVDRDSAHHQKSVEWLQSALNDGADLIGLPWVVQLGFLRLTTSKRVFSRPLSVEEAVAWLDQVKSSTRVRDLSPGKAHFSILRHLLLSSGTGANLTTDAHLAALAIEHDAVIFTGDRDFLRFPGLKATFLF